MSPKYEHIFIVKTDKMRVLWVTLLLLHQGYTLVPVTTGQLGETVTLTCTVPVEQRSSTPLHWYKQGAGDTLKLIFTEFKNKISKSVPGDFASRMNVTYDGKTSHLTIFKTVQEDEGMYHCAITQWNDIWNGVYLSLKGNSERTSNYTVVQTASDPARPGDSVTLQCSVFSDSENKTCPRNLNVFWFKTGSDKSLPQIIYTDGNRLNECDKRSHPQKKCVYNFYKNISSSDDGIYYCAVATCGEILFGDGTKLVTAPPAAYGFIALVVSVICLVISVTINIVLICYRRRAACRQLKGQKRTSSHARHDSLSQTGDDTTEGGQDLNYAALRFSGGKASRGKKKKKVSTEESVYSQIKL
ncbi:uncharacterized protein LOC121643504 [Melanotaenia boesemani]|uniref:uncharacterized protein LOC121643504 n=1 Tax=Melanotaenia boesemani TaxID=1250792 RepID=UPI001C053E4F|nr:uncharacterized protein LOC121643504 [Melanotaenia boesemani]